MADKTDYEHQWLIDANGEIAFWTADTGIHGQTPLTSWTWSASTRCHGSIPDYVKMVKHFPCCAYGVLRIRSAIRQAHRGFALAALRRLTTGLT